MTNIINKGANYVPAIGDNVIMHWLNDTRWQDKGFRFFDNENSFFDHKYLLMSAYYRILDEDTDHKVRLRYPDDTVVLGDSVAGDSQILYKQNNIIKSTSIEKLYNIDNDDVEIQCLDSNNRIIWSSFDKFIRKPCKKIMYRISSIGGRIIEVTEDHSILTVDDNNDIISKKTSDLKINDFLIVPACYPKKTTYIPPEVTLELMEFFGLWIADGSYTSRYMVQKPIPHFAQISISGIHIKECFDLVQSIANTYGKTLRGNNRLFVSRNKIDCRISCDELGLLMTKLGFEGHSDTKKVPDFVFNLPDEYIYAFLRGYFSGDGSISKTDRKVCVSTCSKQLAQDIQTLLLQLGILGSLDIRDSHSFMIHDKVYKAKEQFKINIWDIQSYRKFADCIRFLQKDKNELLDKFYEKGKVIRIQSWLRGVPSPKSTNSRTISRKECGSFKVNHIDRKIYDNDILYLRIKSIKKIVYDGYVYDFSIPIYENFICNNVCCHNSGGYQVMSFAKKGKVVDITPLQVLRWLENNSDIGMNLDIPPVGDFNAALKQSAENFAFFESNRLNYDFKLYNILHGRTLDQIKQWYSCVKGFQFDGWAIGVHPSTNVYLKVLAYLYLIENGEENPLTNTHFFGVSGPANMISLAMLAKRFDAALTFDSSSWSWGQRFRDWWFPLDVRHCIRLGRLFKNTMNDIPCDCPVCQRMNITELYNQTDPMTPLLLSYHDLYQYIETNRMINCMVDDEDTFREYSRSLGEQSLVDTINNMFSDYETHNTDFIYEKYKPLFSELPKKELQSSLFGFKPL